MPEKVTSPRLIRGGSRLTNSFAAACAASSRLGLTSSARIDSETSIAIITVARSRGTLVSLVGLAIAVVSEASASSSAAKARCRRQPGRFGASLPSRSRLANRTANARRRSCSTR